MEKIKRIIWMQNRLSRLARVLENKVYCIENRIRIKKETGLGEEAKSLLERARRLHTLLYKNSLRLNCLEEESIQQGNSQHQAFGGYEEYMDYTTKRTEAFAGIDAGIVVLSSLLGVYSLDLRDRYLLEKSRNNHFF